LLIYSQWKIILLAGIVGCSRFDLFLYQNPFIRQVTLSFALEDEKSGGGLVALV
jgi:hypothetical protein